MAPNLLTVSVFCQIFLTFTAGNKLLVVVIDGVRWNQVLDPNLVGLARFRQSGAKELVPSYPSTGFPNYFSVVTGLNPESHGITDDILYDSQTRTLFSRGIVYGSRSATKWYRGGSGILWNLAEIEGIRTKWYNWPGCTVKGTPQQGLHCAPYENAPQPPVFSRLLKQVTTDLDSDNCDAGFVYTDIMSRLAQRHGPDSELFHGALFEIDWQIKLLHDNLRRAELLDSTNVLIISPFGYRSPSNAPKFINLSWIMPDIADRAQIISFGNRAGVWPKPGRFAQQFTRLYRNSHGLKVYWRHNTPERWGVRDGPFQPPISLVAPDGWRIAANRQEIITISETGEAEGGHDPYTVRDMHGFMLASGPDIRISMPVPSMRMNDVYVLLCRLLDLVPAQNNGTLQGLKSVAIMTRQRNFTDDDDEYVDNWPPNTTKPNLARTTGASHVVTTTDASQLFTTTEGPRLVSTTTASHLIASTEVPHVVSTTDDSHLVTTTDASHLVTTTDVSDVVTSTESPRLVSSTIASQSVTTTNASQVVTTMDTSHLVTTTEGPRLVTSTGASHLVTTSPPIDQNQTEATTQSSSPTATHAIICSPADCETDTNVTSEIESAETNVTLTTSTLATNATEIDAEIPKATNESLVEPAQGNEMDEFIDMVLNGTEISETTAATTKLAGTTAPPTDKVEVVVDVSENLTLSNDTISENSTRSDPDEATEIVGSPVLGEVTTKEPDSNFTEPMPGVNATDVNINEVDQLSTAPPGDADTSWIRSQGTNETLNETETDLISSIPENLSNETETTSESNVETTTSVSEEPDRPGIDEILAAFNETTVEPTVAPNTTASSNETTLMQTSGGNAATTSVSVATEAPDSRATNVTEIENNEMLVAPESLANTTDAEELLNVTETEELSSLNITTDSGDAEDISEDTLDSIALLLNTTLLPDSVETENGTSLNASLDLKKPDMGAGDNTAIEPSDSHTENMTFDQFQNMTIDRLENATNDLSEDTIIDLLENTTVDRIENTTNQFENTTILRSGTTTDLFENTTFDRFGSTTVDPIENTTDQFEKKMIDQSGNTTDLFENTAIDRLENTTVDRIEVRFENITDQFENTTTDLFENMTADQMENTLMDQFENTTIDRFETLDHTQTSLQNTTETNETDDTASPQIIVHQVSVSINISGGSYETEPDLPENLTEITDYFNITIVQDGNLKTGNGTLQTGSETNNGTESIKGDSDVKMLYFPEKEPENDAKLTTSSETANVTTTPPDSYGTTPGSGNLARSQLETTITNLTTTTNPTTHLPTATPHFQPENSHSLHNQSMVSDNQNTTIATRIQSLQTATPTDVPGFTTGIEDTTPFESTTLFEKPEIFRSIQCNCDALLQNASALLPEQLVTASVIDGKNEVYFATNTDIESVSVSKKIPQVRITQRHEVYVVKEETRKTVRKEFTTYGPVSQENLAQIVIKKIEKENKHDLKVFKGEVMCLYCYE